MTFADRDGYIWMDGEMVPWRDATVHVLTHSLHYGMGAFEGIRAYATKKGPAIFRLNEHISRLYDSGHILQMKIPYSQQEVIEACKQCVKINNLESAYIRPLIFYGSEGMGLKASVLKTHLSIAAWQWGTYLGDDAIKNGIRLKVSSFARHHVNVSMVRAKATGHYINSMLASNEVVAMGYDEALLLDTDGFVAEGVGENLFIIKNGVLISPEIASALDGITRKSIMQIADDLGIECITKRVTRDEIYIADEAFLVGTAAELVPINSLDNRKVGDGNREITSKIQEVFKKTLIGEVDKYQNWLSYVS